MNVAPSTTRDSRLSRDTGRRGRAPRLPLRTIGPRTRGPRSIPDLDLAVERVALDGCLAEGLDQMDELLGRGAMSRPCGRDDVLLDHHRAHVVGTEPERDLADLHPLGDPGGLDVWDVVEIDAGDRLSEQIVERRRHVLAGDLAGEPVAVVLERPRDEGAEAACLVLQLADAPDVLDA